MIYLFKLLFAHIIADFPLQPSTMVNAKQSKSCYTSSLALLIHSLIHAVLAYVIIAIWTNWLIPLVVFLSHLIIDITKIKISQCDVITKSKATLFIIDQLAHILVLGLLSYFIFLKPDKILDMDQLFNNFNLWIIAMSYLLVLKPSSILLRQFLERWTPSKRTESEEYVCLKNNNSLQSAGVWIGYIERVMILTFIFLNYFEGIGFLLAAKSIFRFGDLKEPSEVKHTEYVLVGTLASFAIATIIGGIAFTLTRI